MTRSGKHKSKEIRNLIFVEYYYFCCAIYFNAFNKKNSCTMTALYGYMLNIYNTQNKMYIVYYFLSLHELFSLFIS